MGKTFKEMFAGKCAGVKKDADKGNYIAHNNYYVNFGLSRCFYSFPERSHRAIPCTASSPK